MGRATATDVPPDVLTNTTPDRSQATAKACELVSPGRALEAPPGESGTKQRRMATVPTSPSSTELQELVDQPAETLEAEYKSWLDLSANAVKADLARHIAALANHGGGK